MFEIVSGPTVSASSAQNAAAGISVTTYTRGSGLSPAGASSTFNSSGFTVGGTEANAVTNGDFITWGFTSATPFDLTDFGIRYDRSANGPSGIRIDFQANGGAFQTVLSDAAVSDLGETIIGTSLASFGNVTSGTFRLIGFGASATAGTFDFENDAAISSPDSSFQLNGTPTAVPEPASAVIVGTLFLGSVVGARLRRYSRLQNDV
jgi:hypothetical protein